MTYYDQQIDPIINEPQGKFLPVIKIQGSGQPTNCINVTVEQLKRIKDILNEGLILCENPDDREEEAHKEFYGDETF